MIPVWVSIYLDGETHIIPWNDLMIHSSRKGCPCQPRVDKCGDTLIVSHESLDQREFYEVEPRGVA